MHHRLQEGARRRPSQRTPDVVTALQVIDAALQERAQ